MEVVLEDYRYVVRYEIESWLRMDAGDEGYVTKIYGSISWTDSDDDPEGHQCGYIRAIHLRCNEMIENDVYDPKSWAESESDELGEIAGAIYQDDGEWMPAIDEMWDGIEVADLLVLSEIEIGEVHRGRGLGLQVLSRTIELFGGPCGLVACCPFPTEARAEGEIAAKRAHNKLARYVEKLGIKQIPGTMVWARSLVHDPDPGQN
jgi:hypothetical protein